MEYVPEGKWRFALHKQFEIFNKHWIAIINHKQVYVKQPNVNMCYLIKIKAKEK